MSPSSCFDRRARALAACACLLLAFLPSCKLISTTANAPSNIASGLTGGKDKPPGVPHNVVQTELMRFADSFATRLAAATRAFAEAAATPEAHVQALTWSIGQNTAAFTIASGPNAHVALLDMIVLVTLGRTVHEEYFGPKVWGEADRPMLEAYTQLEQDIWKFAAKVLTEAQQQEVRATLREWREQNPDMTTTAFVRMPAFQDLLTSDAKAESSSRGGLGELLSVDPMSGLEPTVREIEKTRQFAERTVFYLQRAPSLLSAQVELLSLKLMRTPEVHGALEDSERISRAAASIAETAATLPAAVSVERDAALKQISAELTAQRQGLVTDLEQAQGPAREILSEARATLEAGAQMSTALQGTLTTLDGFIARFDKPPDPSAPPAEPGKPFDIVEYGEAATRLGAAAHELNGLVATLDRSLPQVQRVLDEALARGERTIDHAFARALQLGGLLIVAVALTTLAVRRLGRASAPSTLPTKG